VITCPNCNRRALTGRHLLYASFEGEAECPSCGRASRLDLPSRWILSCMLAIVLPGVLLWGNVFYSGHLFIVSILVVLGGWRLLSCVGAPILSLERVPTRSSVDGRHAVLVVAVMLTTATVLDAFIASRFEPDAAVQNGRSVSVK
jgi:hypothetical protein